MEMFATPRKGSYTARNRNFDGSFNTFYTSCEVMGESAKSYAIRLYVPIGQHKAREIIKVRKHNVRFKDETPAASTHDYSGAWWND